MLIKNLKSKGPQLINGLTGHVVSFVQLNPADYEHGVANELVPIGEFSLANGQKIQYTATREKWDVEKPGGDSASRTQVPLTLSWAMSVLARAPSLHPHCLQNAVSKIAGRPHHLGSFFSTANSAALMALPSFATAALLLPFAASHCAHIATRGFAGLTDWAHFVDHLVSRAMADDVVRDSFHWDWVQEFQMRCGRCLLRRNQACWLTRSTGMKTPFGTGFEEFWYAHAVLSPTYNLPNYRRAMERPSRRPTISIMMDEGNVDDLLGELSRITRPREDDAEEDAPAPKRQLRSRGPKAVARPATEPVGRVVAKGRGLQWKQSLGER
ncbi:hypothetical protein B0H19DRAFT_1317491 [Mycena capillaripes]|nr:hypothetical protein B0H19DRAFT_1317491 [Mycena capillaripes]